MTYPVRASDPTSCLANLTLEAPSDTFKAFFTCFKKSLLLRALRTTASKLRRGQAVAHKVWQRSQAFQYAMRDQDATAVQRVQDRKGPRHDCFYFCELLGLLGRKRTHLWPETPQSGALGGAPLSHARTEQVWKRNRDSRASSSTRC